MFYHAAALIRQLGVLQCQVRGSTGRGRRSGQRQLVSCEREIPLPVIHIRRLSHKRNEKLSGCARPGLADSADADGPFRGDASRSTFGRTVIAAGKSQKTPRARTAAPFVVLRTEPEAPSTTYSD